MSNQEPTAHVYQCDLDQLLTSECVVEAYSLEMRHLDKGWTVPLYSAAELHKLQVEIEKLRARFKVLQGAVYIDIRRQEYIQLDTKMKNAALWGDKQ
jgi:hypothetical protein